MTEQKPFTGRVRRRKTTPLVRATDAVARGLITIGGIGTIVAVLAVCLFLVWVVVPLFLPARINAAAARPSQQGEPLRLVIDEYQLTGWSLARDGSLQVLHARTGETLQQRTIAEGAALTAASFGHNSDQVAFGFADGTVRLGTITFRTSYPPAETLSANARNLEIGGAVPIEGGMIQRTDQDQFRLQTVEVDLLPPFKFGESPPRLLAHALGGAGGFLAAYFEDGRLSLYRLAEESNFLTGETTWQIGSPEELPLPPDRAGLASHLLITERGDSVYLAWEDGILLRYNTRDPANITLAETIDLTEGDARLTALGFLLGGTTLVAGDSLGNVSGWFPVRSPDAASSDGVALTPVHTLPAHSAAVTALGMSGRTRMFAAGYADGLVRVFHMTSEQLLAEAQVVPDAPIRNVFMAARDDGLFAATPGAFWQADFDPRYPEVSFRALLLPVWYEGYDRPVHVWQSSGGTTDLEPKLGMMPLIFGTLKATFYSLLFGVPVALLAAVYSSEFLEPRARSRIKPTIELMASLPSVVLGFLAALVFAPLAEKYMPDLLAAIIAVPLAALTTAYVWQLLPPRLSLRLSRFRLLAACLVLPIGFGAGLLAGPVVERLLFAGDFMRWLDGQAGSGAGAWVFLLLPLSAIAMTLFMNRVITPRLVRRMHAASRGRFAALDALKFVLGAAGTLLLAYGLAQALTAVGWDPRGQIVDTYEQRNALIVGFVMGFAIIPLIYTIAEDALSSVPEQLRSASLGAGATPWQTAVRIVIPTAMSGLFSAVMIGLGRAVGETMIVLMAAGNTPIMEWNPFNGFRTLSANIAVELPEAVQNSFHYRTLFLAALTLFVMTFLVNTLAEFVRLRFRRRVYQL